MELQDKQLIDYCLNRCDAEERKQVEEVLAASDEQREHVNNLLNALRIANDLGEMEEIDAEAAYTRMMKQIKRRKFTKVSQRLMRYAAFLSLPLLLSTFILSLLYTTKPVHQTQYAEVRTPQGVIARYVLPDSSVVWLNGGTTLRFPTIFDSHTRNVELSGEGFFKVKSDRNSPFTVITPQGVSTLVHGTEFNVSAYADRNTVEVVLQSGKVEVFAPTSETGIPLIPGKAVTYHLQTLSFEEKEVDLFEKTAWKDGKLVFREATLREMFARLSQHYNVDFVLSGSNLDSREYHATFQDETIEQVLDFIGKTVNLKWHYEKRDEEHYTSYKKKIIIDLY